MRITVSVVPRSSKNEIIRLTENDFKIKLKAAPVDGAANSMLIDFLSATFKKPKSLFHITSGLRGRKKTIVIDDQPD